MSGSNQYSYPHHPFIPIVPVLRSVIATVLIGIVFLIVESTGNAEGLLHPYKWYILAFFFTLSFMIDQLMSQGFRNKREKFVQFYLSVTVVRLILSIIFIGVFLYLGVEDNILFVLNFFVLYLFYTCFEIWGVYRKLRAN